MSTLRQIESNRRNAQKSTGPTSVTGKATSSMNALKTGIHAESLVLPSENLADLEQLTADFYQHHQPTTPDARGFGHQPTSFLVTSSPPPPYPNLQSRLDAPRRARLRALDALQKLKAEAAAAPDPAPEVETPTPVIDPPSLTHSPQTTSPQIGFVPSTPSAPPPQPAPAAPS